LPPSRSALAETAPAPAIPAEYRGEWCEHRAYYVRKGIEHCRRHSETWIRVTPTLYEGSDWRCQLVKSKPADAPKIGVLTDGHIITFDCQFEEGKDISALWFYMAPDMLDRMLTSLESRRNKAFGCVAEYRASLAHQLRESSDRIIDGKDVLRLEDPASNRPTAA